MIYSIDVYIYVCNGIENGFGRSQNFSQIFWNIIWYIGIIYLNIHTYN